MTVPRINTATEFVSTDVRMCVRADETCFQGSQASGAFLLATTYRNGNAHCRGTIQILFGAEAADAYKDAIADDKARADSADFVLWALEDWHMRTVNRCDPTTSFQQNRPLRSKSEVVANR
ncbi:hypothetical protein HYALB_00010819 [Hymenoscyphus albidus]|uniref:Uncharacterized protein n=1 Tax=Hymenoscyphus albidus TaxID=595503 RepID=A0A9N9PVP1_9HELO|nr:hypothetical protein HYALB_00010819 [Hymenoscyphus albidus]